MGNFTKINLDPSELLEHVDEMLAWLAVGSQSSTEFSWEDYLRAVPVITLGRSASAFLTVDGVEAAEGSAESRADAPVRDEYIRLLSSNPNFLGERPSCAILEEVDPNVTIDAYPSSGDDLSDAKVGQVDLAGVRYRLSAFFKCKKADAEAWRSAIPARLHHAGLHVYQETYVMRDGRSGGCYLPLLATGGRIFDVNGGPISVNSPLVTHAVAHLGVQAYRRSQWTIELSMGEHRTGVGLATDATGAIEFVRMLRRSHGSAAHARRAIVHWVREHLRRSRKEAADPTVVRAHMRGRQQEKIGSYFARIYPSRVDIDRACNGTRFDRDAPTRA